MSRGRPFGGLMSLIRNDLRYLTKTIHSEDRFSVIKLAIFLLSMYICHVWVQEIEC